MPTASISHYASVYNAEAYIAHTLDSVLSQTYKNIEAVVVDDGSCDGTAQIVETMIQRDDRVIVLRQPNSRVSVVRNLTIEKSRCECIALLMPMIFDILKKLRSKYIVCYMQGLSQD